MFPGVVFRRRLHGLIRTECIRPITRGEVLIDSESRSAGFTERQRARSDHRAEVSRMDLKREIHLDLTKRTV